MNVETPLFAGAGEAAAFRKFLRTRMYENVLSALFRLPYKMLDFEHRLDAIDKEAEEKMTKTLFEDIKKAGKK